MKRNCLMLAVAVLFVTKVTAQSWQIVGTPLPSVAEVGYTVLRFDSAGTAYVCQDDDGIFDTGGNYYGKLSVLKYNGTDWVGVGPTGFTPHQAYTPSFALAPNGTPYVSLQNNNNGRADSALVMKFNGTGWEQVGNTNTTLNTYYTSVAFDAVGIPYLAIAELLNNHFKATVLKYDGSKWNLLGNRGFSKGDANYISINIDGNGSPYVLFEEPDSGQVYGGATVMKYNGTDWVVVGSRRFTAGYVMWPAMAIDRIGNLYVVYKNYLSAGFDGKGTVMKYDGNTWATVGGSTLPAGSVSYTSIAIDNRGKPYVAFRDSLNGYKATVMGFDGNIWQTLGIPGFSSDEARYTCIALDPNGRPHVVYEDFGNAMHATVMKYTGPLDTTHTGISEPITENTFTIRPNPSAGVFHVSFTQQVTNVQVYDMQGRLIVPTCNEMDDNTLTIDLTGKARGIYFFRASTLTGMVNGKLVVK